MKTSLEVEYWVIDEDGSLASPGTLADRSEHVEREFVEPLFEIKTTPCETQEELREELIDRLRETIDAARARGKRLVPLATPLDAGPIEYLPGERTDIQRRVVGEAFEHSKRCAGTHVHFDREAPADQLNVLTALDPAFALLTSSPYYRGERIAACARPMCYRSRCYGGDPEFGQLWEYVESEAEWTARVEECFARFKRLAIERGVPVEQVEERFRPEDATWTPVRLREEFSTVEWRSPDATLPSEILRMAADTKAVVERAAETPVSVGGEGRVTDDAIELPPFETLRDHVDEAMRNGTTAPSVADYLERMGLDPSDYRPIGPRIDGRDALTRREARALRLAYADRLEADVEGLATRPRSPTLPRAVGGE